MPLTQAEKEVLYDLTGALCGSPDYTGPFKVGRPGFGIIGVGRAAKQAVKNLHQQHLVSVVRNPQITSAAYAVLPRDLPVWKAQGWRALTTPEIMEL